MELPIDWSRQPLVAACSRATQERVLTESEDRDQPPGTVLIAAGTLAEGVFVLAEGIVRIFHQQEDGTQFTVKLLRAPDTFGEPEIIRSSPWIASVQALTLSRVLVIPRLSFLWALENDHGFCRAVLEDVNAKFFGTIQASRSLGFEGVKARLARVLLQYVEHFGREKEGRVVIRHPLTRERLASEVGVARRSVDRALKDFTSEGLLGQEKGWLVVEDARKLAAQIQPAPAPK